MGSFSSTCCISGLPLEAQDDVYCLLLVEKFYAEHWDSSWEPFVFPLLAKYNDYGSFNETTDDHLKQTWLYILKENLIELEVGENIYHDVAINKKSSFEEVRIALWEDRVKIKVPRFISSEGSLSEEGRKIRLAMFRKDVWDELKLTNSKYNGCFLKRTMIREYLGYDTYLSKHSNLLDSNYDDLISDFMRLNQFLFEVRVDWRPSLTFGAQFGNWDCHFFFNVVVNKVISDKIKKLEEEV